MNRRYFYLGLILLLIFSVIIFILNRQACDELASKTDEYMILQKNANSLSLLQKEWGSGSQTKGLINRLKSFADSQVKKNKKSIKIVYPKISSSEFDRIISYMHNNPLQIKKYTITKVDNAHLYLEVEFLR